MSQIGFNPSTSSYKGANNNVSQNPNNAQRFGIGAKTPHNPFPCRYGCESFSPVEKINMEVAHIRPHQTEKLSLLEKARVRLENACTDVAFNPFSGFATTKNVLSKVLGKPETKQGRRLTEENWLNNANLSLYDADGSMMGQRY